MKIVAKTDQGKVRKDNQDSFAAGELPGGVVWAVVCDGMGGAKSGNVASALSAEVFAESVSRYAAPRISNGVLTLDSDDACQFFYL